MTPLQRWRRLPLRMRLSVWHAAVAAVVLLGFSAFVYELLEHRLEAQLLSQLHVDFETLESQLYVETDGKVGWRLAESADDDDDYLRPAAWFDVWSPDGRLLLRSGPPPQVAGALPAPQSASGWLTAMADATPPLHLRMLQKDIRVGGVPVILRVMRSDEDYRAMLQQVVAVSMLGLPLTVLVLAVGGYLIVQRSLRPVADMAAQARRISSESLSARLPNPNPYDELGQLAAIFNETLDRLERSFVELRRFTADASHELRSPLTALYTVGEVGLRSNADSASLRETIGSMLEEAARLRDLIDSLLMLARMDNEGAALPLQRVELAEVAREVADSLGVLAAERQQRIHVAGDETAAALAEPILLRQALMNIVHNAIRHGEIGGDIAIRVGRHEESVFIEVKDNGPGIAAEHIERIFDRFYRADRARSRSDGGTGLGLAIALQAVRRQGGRIDADSEPGAGSVFRIVLRAANAGPALALS